MLGADLVDDALLFCICSPACANPANVTTASIAPSAVFPSGFPNCGQEHATCAVLWRVCVVIPMNVVGWSVNTAACSDGECVQAVCTELLIYPPSLFRAPCKLSCLSISPDKRVCDLRQSQQPELKVGGSPACIVWGQLGFFSDKPVPLAAVLCTLLLNCNHNPLYSRRCYPHRRH